MICSYVSINEQSCGTCEYFSQDHSNTTCGTCWWATKNPVPIAYVENISVTYAAWGKDCPCWIEKVVDIQAALGYNYTIDTN